MQYLRPRGIRLMIEKIIGLEQNPKYHCAVHALKCVISHNTIVNKPKPGAPPLKYPLYESVLC